MEKQFRLVFAPSYSVDVSLQGCRLRLLGHGSGAIGTRETVVWLADLRLDPTQVWRDEGQLMGDGSGRTWVDYQVVYQWRPEILARYAADIQKWRENIDQAHDLMEEIMAHPAPEFSIANAEMRRIYEGMIAGAYGPFFQRNHG